MGIRKFLHRLQRNESGNVLMIGAAVMPLLLGSAGLAVDTVQVALWKRQLQRAADSAAIAGAHALAQGAAISQSVANDLDEHVELDLAKTDQPVIVVKNLVAGSWAAGEISDVKSCADRKTLPCYSKAVQVGLTGNRKLPFMSVFTRENTEFSVSAAAAVLANGEYCFVALHEEDTGIDGKGGGETTLGCGMASNSDASNAVDLGGSIEILASPIGAVGNIDYADKNLSDDVELLPYSVPVRDPFAHVEFPSPPSGCTASLPAGTTSVPNGACYVNWDVTNNLTIDDGATVFVNGGEFDVRRHSTVTGRNVTIILTGDNSTLSLNGGGTLDITAPGSGPMKGVAIYRDRNATDPGDTNSNKRIKLNGGAGLKITGAVYMPSTHVWFGGNADITATCLQVITSKIEFRGGATISNRCSNYNFGAVKHRIIRMVK